MTAPLTIVLAAAITAVMSVPQPALAIDVGGAACKREWQGTQKKMQETLTLIDGVRNVSAEAKCRAYASAAMLADEVRESTARCVEPKERTSAVRDADDVIDAIDKAYQKWCPPRPGMVRVKMRVVKRVTRDQLPKPLAAVHRCGGDGEAMHFSDERFDLGRLVLLGCPGTANPTDEQVKARNLKAELLHNEQAALYVTRDRDGDDPVRLTFPILTVDGQETATDMLIPARTHVGDKLDLIVSNWEPAKDGICRVRAIWRVADGQARLVLWQEATDCSAGSKTEFKTVLERQ